MRPTEMLIKAMCDIALRDDDAATWPTVEPTDCLTPGSAPLRSGPVTLNIFPCCSNYLRYSLDTADVQVVPVSAELAMIRSFLRVQNIRFGARLKPTIVANDDTKRRRIPAFLLQPLVCSGIADPQRNSLV